MQNIKLFFLEEMDSPEKGQFCGQITTETFFRSWDICLVCHHRQGIAFPIVQPYLSYSLVCRRAYHLPPHPNPLSLSLCMRACLYVVVFSCYTTNGLWWIFFCRIMLILTIFVENQPRAINQGPFRLHMSSFDRTIFLSH